MEALERHIRKLDYIENSKSGKSGQNAWKNTQISAKFPKKPPQITPKYLRNTLQVPLNGMPGPGLATYLIGQYPKFSPRV